jgi:ring-1,2-phenylacetyl-CoA epoxidase subunit PaaE
MLKFHPLRVVQIAPEAEDAVAVALEVPAALREEYRGRAGQHVVVRASIDGEDTRRTYSVVSAPGEAPLRIVPRVHAHGRMSQYLAGSLRAGDTLEVLPPNGSFTVHDGVRSGSTFVAFAAGCGITPVLAIVRELLAHDAGRVIVFYGNTGGVRAMCLEELLALKDKYLARLALHFVMSREPQEFELYNGRLDAARVRRFASMLFRPQEVSEYFVCGPGDMIEQISAALRELGVEAARVHAEHFTVATAVASPAASIAVASPAASTAVASPAASTVAPAAPTVAPSAATVAPSAATVAPAASPAAPVTATADPGLAEVTVHMDGRRRSFTMRRDGETVLDAAARAGLELPFSCRAGVCSTCRTKVLSGEVEMAQNYALEEGELEQGYVLACQSHVKSATLELDYDER